MNKVKETVTLFTKLRSFPKTQILLLYCLIEIILLTILTQIILLGFIDFFSIVFLNYLFFWSIVIIVGNFIAYLLTMNDRILTYRRHLILTMTSTIVFFMPFLFFSILYYVLSISLPLDLLFYISIGLTLSFRVVVLYSVGEKALYLRLLSAFSLIAVIIFCNNIALYYSPIITSLNYRLVAMEMTIWSILTIIFLSIISIPSRQLLKISGFKLFRSFASMYLAKDKTLFEKNLDILAHNREIYIDTIFFKKENGKNILFILPQIHPGPLRDVGSSNMPALIMNDLNNKELCSVVFHSTTTHGFNLPKEKYVKEIIDRIKEEIINIEVCKEKISKIYQEKTNNFVFTMQLLNDTLFLSISSADGHIDDISSEVGVLIEEIIKRKFPQIRNVFLVDAHSRIIIQKSESIYFESSLSSALLNQIVNALERFNNISNQESSSNFEIGFGQSEIDYPPDFGFGPGGIRAILIKVDEQKALYILFDGNNVDYHFKDWIIKEILKKFKDIDIIEIFTTDTHYVNGLSRTRFGYHPIGEIGDKKEILSRTLKAIHHAYKDLGATKIGYKRFFVSTKILGEKKVDTLLNVIVLSFKLLKYMSIIFIFLAIILTTLIYLLLL